MDHSKLLVPMRTWRWKANDEMWCEWPHGNRYLLPALDFFLWHNEDGSFGGMKVLRAEEPDPVGKDENGTTGLH
jgi:hypothetical protein